MVKYEIEMLREEESRILEAMKDVEVDSSEYDKLRAQLLTITKAISEFVKLDIDDKKNDTEMYRIDIEEKSNKKKRWIDIGLGILGIGVPTLTTCYWLVNGFKFEETGYFSSKAFNWLLNNQFKKK